ncbi:MAG: type I secretion system permease/ATPase, partial [Gammaproteobacteria bacterium]|nr:type I secretion system permease/ATPase [Gammaproteobacteria bacterium]
MDKNEKSVEDLSHTEHVDEDVLLLSLLAMAKLHGMPASENSPVAGLPLVDGQLTPKLFVRAAKRVGLSAKIIKRPLQQISGLLLPVVLLLKDNHACILLSKEADGQFKMLYPETGDSVTHVSLETLQEVYTGFAILANPIHDFGHRIQADISEKKGHWFWSTMLLSWRIYRDVLVASFLINLFAVVNPLFVMNVYDRVVPNDAQETLWVLAIGVAIVVVFDFTLRLLRSKFIDVAGKKADVILSSRLLEKVLGMKLSARPPSVGLFANNFREFDGIRDFITSMTITTLIDMPFVIIFLLVIYLLAGPLVLVPMLAIPVIIIYGFLIQKPLQQAAENASKASSQKSSLLVESLTVADTVKTRGAESVMQSRWEHAVGQLAKWDAKSRFIANSASNIATFVQQFVTLSVVVYGVYLLMDGLLSMGGLIASVMLSGRAIAPMAQVALLTTRYHQSRAALNTLNDMMDLPVERPEGKHFLTRPELQGNIQFEDVTFAYPNTENAVLKNVSFAIKPGEKVGIIGRIGSGKSTIEKLLLNLYQPDKGAIRIDGVDIRQLDPADLRRNIGYVPQDISLFYGSVRENITIGAAHVSD